MASVSNRFPLWLSLTPFVGSIFVILDQDKNIKNILSVIEGINGSDGKSINYSALWNKYNVSRREQLDISRNGVIQSLATATSLVALIALGFAVEYIVLFTIPVLFAAAWMITNHLSANEAHELAKVRINQEVKLKDQDTIFLLLDIAKKHLESQEDEQNETLMKLRVEKEYLQNLRDQKLKKDAYPE